MQEPLHFQVQLLSKFATLPKRQTEGSAGYDLFSPAKFTIPPNGQCTVFTDIAVAIPRGYYGRIAPRSSLAAKHGLDVGAGVIDADFRGNVGVILFNHSQKVYFIEPGERIAQLILQKIATPPIIQSQSLDSTTRGERGFGSTGQ